MLVQVEAESTVAFGRSRATPSRQRLSLGRPLGEFRRSNSRRTPREWTTRLSYKSSSPAKFAKASMSVPSASSRKTRDLPASSVTSSNSPRYSSHCARFDTQARLPLSAARFGAVIGLGRVTRSELALGRANHVTWSVRQGAALNRTRPSEIAPRLQVRSHQISLQMRAGRCGYRPRP